MNEWEQLIARLTDRLRVDEELRLDVARELRTHLEDSAAEFRRAGEAEEQAAVSAARALGDANVLAEQLWQANRRRLRIRGVLRWAAQVALVPIAIIVTLVLMAGMRGGYPVYASRLELFHMPAWCPSWFRIRLPEEQRLILGGPAEAKTPLERAKAISDRWPDNPVYYGDYAIQWMNANDNAPRQGATLTSGELQEALAILERGKPLDPNNAFYDFFQAAYLIGASCKLADDPNASYQLPDRHRNPTTRPYQLVTITDRHQFGQGLAHLRSGLAKPRYANPMMQMMRLRLDLLPPPRRLNEYLERISRQVSVVGPPLSRLRELGKALSAAAVDAAGKGRAAEPEKLLELANRLSASLGANADWVIQLLVAQDLLAANAAFTDLWAAGQAQQEEDFRLRHGGVLWAIVATSLPGYRYDPEPLRTAEHLVALESGLIILLAGLLFVALLLGIITLLNMPRRRENRPILVFVGWRRIGRICLYSVILPFGMYALYRFLLGGAAGYGLNLTFAKTMLELVVLMAVVVGLLTRLSYSAIRRRAAELGLSVPAPIRLRERRCLVALGALIALAVVAYCAVGPGGRFETSPTFSFPLVGRVTGDYALGWGIGVALSTVVVLFLVICEIREYLGRIFRPPYKHFRRSLYRSMVPILAAAVILVGAVLGWGLAQGEVSAIQRAKGMAGFSLTNEIEHSDFRLLKEQFIQRQRELTAKSLSGAATDK
jgi:hypothetical protein